MPEPQPVRRLQQRPRRPRGDHQVRLHVAQSRPPLGKDSFAVGKRRSTAVPPAPGPARLECRARLLWHALCLVDDDDYLLLLFMMLSKCSWLANPWSGRAVVELGFQIIPANYQTHAGFTFRNPKKKSSPRSRIPRRHFLAGAETAIP